MLLISHTGGKHKAEPKPTCGTPNVALQSTTPLQKSLLSSPLYFRVSPQNQASLNVSRGEIIHFPQNLLWEQLYFPKHCHQHIPTPFTAVPKDKVTLFFILMILRQISIRKQDVPNKKYKNGAHFIWPLVYSCLLSPKQKMKTLKSFTHHFYPPKVNSYKCSFSLYAYSMAFSFHSKNSIKIGNFSSYYF